MKSQSLFRIKKIHKPIFKSKSKEEKAIDQLIKELEDLTLNDTIL